MRRARRTARRVAAGIATALVLAGCGGTAQPASSPTTRSTSSPTPSGQANTITDGKGRTITVDGPPQRVVCLVSLCEDMLLELGLRPVARTGMLLEQPSFLGAEAREVPQVPGGFLNPDVEAIIGLRPDLVIGLYQSHDGLAPALQGVAPLWIIQSDSIEDSIHYLRNLGTLTGRTSEAAQAEQRFRDKLAQAERAASRQQTAVVLIGLDGKFGVVAGSYLSDLLGHLFTYPWQPRPGDPGPEYSLEEIVAADPDVMFVLTYNNANPDGPPLSEVLAANPLWSQITAVKNNKVFEVSTALWGNGRGTRSLSAVAGEAMKLVGPGA